MRTCIFFLVLMSLAGCGQSSVPANAPNQPPPRVSGEPVGGSISVSGTDGAAADNVRVGGKFTVSGEFQLDDPSLSAPPIVARAIRVDGDKRVIFSNNGLIPNAKDGHVQFTVEMDAPSEPGDYEVDVIAGPNNMTVATTTLSVKPGN